MRVSTFVTDAEYVIHVATGCAVLLFAWDFADPESLHPRQRFAGRWSFVPLNPVYYESFSKVLSAVEMYV